MQTVAAELIRTGDKRSAARAAGVSVKKVDRMLQDPVVGKVVLDAVEAALQEAGSSPVEVVLALRRMALSDPRRLLDERGTGMRKLLDMDVDEAAAIDSISFVQALDKEGDVHDLMDVHTVSAKDRANAQVTLAKMHKLLVDRKEHSTPPGRPFEIKPETKADVIRGMLSMVRPKKDPR